MMKNRDTASNPYRVPRQPTAKWIKVSIIGLFFSNVALIGGLVFQIFATEQCTRTCAARNATQRSTNAKDGGTETLLSDQSEKTSYILDSFQLVTDRVGRLELSIGEIHTSIGEVEEMCKKSVISVDRPGRTRSTESSYLPQPSNGFEKLASLTVELAKLDAMVREHIADAEHLCKDGHYRYGMHCYYVGEAKIPQERAKTFCAGDYGAKGTLAIIKDKFVQDFLASKIPNFLHSYWIGIERAQRSLGVKASTADRSSLKKNEAKDMAPEPLVAAAQKSADVDPFEYVDGTRVQSKVWEMWAPRETTDGARQQRDCVALTYHRATSTWYWQDHDCGARLGYVCQYFVMGIGY